MLLINWMLCLSHLRHRRRHYAVKIYNLIAQVDLIKSTVFDELEFEIFFVGEMWL